MTEASEIWLTLADGRTVPATPIGYDQDTGFGLVQALGRLDMPALQLGDSADAVPGSPVVSAGAGGAGHSLAAKVVARQEFAGYWEYLLDEAIFTAPAHPYWGGTGLIGGDGRLVGIGSLQLEQATDEGEGVPLNMYVPTDLLKPILDDMMSIGQPNRPPRPWLGLYATEVDDRVVIAGVSGKGPAGRALREGDIVLSVGGMRVTGPGRPVPQDLVAGRCRREGADDRAPRRPAARHHRALGRPQPLPQGTEPALSGVQQA